MQAQLILTAADNVTEGGVHAAIRRTDEVG